MGSLIPGSDRKPLGKRENKKQKTRRRKAQREPCRLYYKTKRNPRSESVILIKERSGRQNTGLENSDILILTERRYEHKAAEARLMEIGFGHSKIISFASLNVSLQSVTAQMGF